MSVRGARSEAGMTLIEAVVAMTIFAVVATANFRLLMLSAVTSRANTLDGHAVALAVQEREDLRSLVYSAIVSRTAPSSPDTFKGAAFTISTTIQDNTPLTNTKTATITVSWLGRSYVMRTVYTNING